MTVINGSYRRPFHLPRGASGSYHGASSFGEESQQNLNSALESGDGREVPEVVASAGPSRRTSQITAPHTELYTRYRYYSRLRAPAEPDDHVLVSTMT